MFSEYSSDDEIGFRDTSLDDFYLTSMQQFQQTTLLYLLDKRESSGKSTAKKKRGHKGAVSNMPKARKLENTPNKHSNEMDSKKETNQNEPKRAVIFTCTYYNDVTDLRFHQCISTIRHCQNLPIVIVDGSPPEVHEALKNTGALIFRESKRFGDGKGGALREASHIAASLPGVNAATWLCWQEAEKTDMIRCWQDLLSSQSVKDTDEIITPNRDDDSFKKSYPIEQYHSESYGNHYLNCVMRRALDENTNSSIGNIDWHFGPFAFRQKLVKLWTSYKGNSYDAQLVPIVHSIRKGYRINTDITVPFRLDEKMKEQEEGNIEFIEKRLNQLNSLDPRIKMAWSEKFYCD